MKKRIDDMTPKQRLLTAIRGGETDRLPWSPFLAYFWESQPERIRNKGSLWFLEEIGADPLFRGAGLVWSVKRNNCDIRETNNGSDKRITYDTPVGVLIETYRRSYEGKTSFIIEHPVVSSTDFKVLEYMYENTEIEPALGYFDGASDILGEKGLLLPVVGTEQKTCFQSMVEHWVGTQTLVFALADYPDIVEECLTVMQDVALKTVKIAAESRAEAFISWEDSSTTNYGPSYYNQYVKPEIDMWGNILHDAGKILIQHACGHIKGLLSLMAKSPIDMVESISPPPTGNIDLWDAKSLLPEKIGLIGGIEPTVFLSSTLEELDDYVQNLIERMKGCRFILANSDSCPLGVSLEKFQLVADIVRKRQ
jgi:hypothetical protein